MTSTTAYAWIKGANHFEGLQQSIKFINEKFYEYEIDKRDKKNKCLTGEKRPSIQWLNFWLVTSINCELISIAD